MQLDEKLVEALHDLVKINNDRIEGYRKAIASTEDADLKALFLRMADESRMYIEQLNEVLLQAGSDAENGTSIYGRIYRAWIDVKATFTGHDRHSILAACEYGEDAAQRTYEDILRSAISMPYSVRELIANQKGALRSSHDTVKTYRNLEKAVH
ncbi:ferritin-like domain-containing protein [Chitinophaga tropicalis]|uniref:PA2169 family four-helix-bundle protein n=1 Tax=Chitinophaga tropicalis TaxID=2683588 RepID=A0A7K1TY49_9BACT|nr:PA2169 family four-helix-bundle protein [Chitinophaga tropicalis]MVT07029.1 PA2169 family four-helix-bundle protein [Chitinophaga tropicalis]